MAHSAVALRPLDQRAAVAPSNENILSKALAFIHRIDRIEVPAVVKHDGHTFYSVGIVFKSKQSNIPTNCGFVHRKTDATPAKSHAPSVVVHRRFCEFMRLRKNLRYHALVGYELCSCSFCNNVLKLLEYGSAQPRLRVKLFSDEVTTRYTLESFVNAVLRLVAEATAPNTRQLRRGCENKVQIPLVLYHFLLHVEEQEAKAKHARRPPQVWSA